VPHDLQVPVAHKQRHDTVAQDLIHRAFKTMYGVHHDMNGRIQELLGRFGVEVLDQLGRVLDVSEKYRHLFSFAFEGTTGGEDFFCEVLGGVGEGWLVCCGWWRCWLDTAGG
jgi:hypothetical protein